MQRLEFLAALHAALCPRGYLEIGVQTGASLRLAQCPALGIEPKPMLRYPLPPSTVVAECESDEFFGFPRGKQVALGLPQPLDLVLIDGLHLHEQVLRDFLNVEQWSNPRTVVVIDDVLPRNQAEAVRNPVPERPDGAVRVSRLDILWGDWAGDVWKVEPLLAVHRPDLAVTLVDVEPTGMLLVRGLDPQRPDGRIPGWAAGDEVPLSVLRREFAVPPEVALKAVAS